ncbi:hypothetical protein [Mucilaginibacter aquaedulcis]|uniref:hypothetical protein n=1 Tax=Mucilaginibacter aquaedulcis TaxID=1187081 RepID=UPI0025B479D1|nr:hypothetical protein [Mucilaginibacter aquaedulcis]MDN3549294.1 hypothetical protein [Mucilaginibacter aquaedulcis]
MKKHGFLLFIVMLFTLIGCKKDNNNNSNTPAEPKLTIQKISVSTFENSPWEQVFGGIALLEFDLKDSKDSTSSRIKDSIDLKNIAAYNRDLGKGKYDIIFSTKNQPLLADTFIHLSAKIKSYSVDEQQALSLNPVTTDGLVTISKDFIKDNTIPVFKPDTGTKSYKMGLTKGFYYLYVKGGAKGNLTFALKATGQTVSKALNIQPLNQYNLAITINKTSVEVVFAPFKYNQIAVNSSTLITLNLIPQYYLNTTTYFVVTDENGNVLKEAKYINGTTSFQLSSAEPYEKDRINFFQIEVSDDVHSLPWIVGYLQIKKGSVFSNPPLSMAKPQNQPLRLHLKNTSGFDKLDVSTDVLGITLNSLKDTVNIQNLAYTDDSKIYAQMLKNNKVLYNFFDIDKGVHDFNVDLSKLTKTSLVKNMTAPGGNFQVWVSARADLKYDNSYYFGSVYNQNNHIDYYYPAESFPEYTTTMFYSIGDFNYFYKTTGTTIPDKPVSFTATFNNPGSSLGNFKPSFSGLFDLYTAHFEYLGNETTRLSADFYSPATANYTNVKLPDFSKYLGVKSIDLTKIALKRFELAKMPNFKDVFNYASFNVLGASVSRYY